MKAVTVHRMARSLYIMAALGTIAAPGRLFGQAALRITAPASGTVARPGETIVVYVSPSGGPFKTVFIGGPGLKTNSQVLSAPPFQFSVTIPSTATLGPTELSAMGSSGTQSILSDPVSIDIERPDSPQSLKVDHPQLELRAGHEIPISVYGKYGDGATVDLTKSTATKYATVPPGVASVSSDGLVTGVTEGSTTLVIHHQSRQIAVKVVVTRVRK
jgi:hypothetical protein